MKYGVDENLSLETSRRLGIILGNMHEHVTVDNGLLGINNGIVKDWESFYREWLIHNAEDVKDKYENLGSRIIECAYNTEIPSSNRFVLSPMDFHSGNALFREDKIVAVIDFERCYGGDPRWSFEVSKRMVESNSDDSAFCEGYKSVREIERKPVYRLAGICREMRTAHMLYQSPEDNLSEYSKEIENIAYDLF